MSKPEEQTEAVTNPQHFERQQPQPQPQQPEEQAGAPAAPEAPEAPAAPEALVGSPAAPAEQAGAPAAVGSSPPITQTPPPIYDPTGMTRMPPTDTTRTASALDVEAAAAADEKKNKIKAEIKKLEEDTKAKNTILDKEKNLPGTTDDRKNEISTMENANRVKLFAELNRYHNKLTGGNTPFPITAGSALVKAVIGILEKKFHKAELGTEVANIELDMVVIVKNEIQRIKENNESADPIYLQQLADLLVSLEKEIQSKSPVSTGGGALNPSGTAGLPSGTAGLPSGTAGLPSETAEALDGVAGKLSPEAGATALGEEEKAIIPQVGEVTAALGGEEGKAIIPQVGEVAAAVAAAPMKGGGIRKSSHPKYMNQVSENRNKIFKKELEIISSIRRFHRSHTIRKRDRINSILGLRKSRNNKNNGNTKRHMHRHNKHKHKSAKHIKK